MRWRRSSRSSRCATGIAPPTINVDNPDPELVLDLVRDKPRTLRDGDIAAINNSFGFGGHNVALVVASV